LGCEQFNHTSLITLPSTLTRTLYVYARPLADTKDTPMKTGKTAPHKRKSTHTKPRIPCRACTDRRKRHAASAHINTHNQGSHYYLQVEGKEQSAPLHAHK